MIKTFKYKLYNSKSNKHLISQIELASEIYNHCISLYKNYYRLFHKSLNLFKLQKHITKLKKLSKYSHWRKLPSQSIQDIPERINRCYKNFFRRNARHLPNYRSRYKYKSFSLKQAGYKLFDDNQIVINKKEYKYFKSRDIEGEIKLLTIKRDTIGDLYLFIICEVPDPEPIFKTGTTAGMDFGLKNFLVLSDNTQIDNPEYLKNSLNKLKKVQQVLSRKSEKSKRSNNRRKAVKAVERVHKKIFNQRHDFLFKLSRKLCFSYDELCVENLDLDAMKRDEYQGRKTSDLSYGQFLNILEYYCEKTGKKLVKISRWYPSSKTCSNCGWYNKYLDRNERVFKCKDCGSKIDRDLNASINIHRVGSSTLCECNNFPQNVEENYYDSIESQML